MSDETEIALDIKIKTAESAGSVKELKKSLKELKDELANVSSGSEEFKKLSKTINDTEGKLGDLNDEFKTLTGSGVERATSSLGLLREGFANFDFDKIKLGFKGMGAAMSAVPIFFMVQGLQYLWENFDKIVEIFTPVNFGLNKMTKEFEALQKVTSLLGDELKREIDILEAQGASSEKILAKKKELVKIQINEAQTSINLRMEKIKEVLMNDSVTESIDKTVAALYRKVGAEEAANALEKAMYANKYQRVQEDFKSIEASQKNILDLKNSLLVEEAKINKKSSDDYKKAEDEKLKKTQENFEAYKKAEKELDDYRRKLWADWEKENKAISDRLRASRAFGVEEEKAMEGDIYNTALGFVKQAEDDKKKAADDEIDLEKKKAAAKEEILNSSIQIASDVSGLYFQNEENKIKKQYENELKAAKGNEVEQKKIKERQFNAERDLRKRQFNINKAFGIAGAIVDGVKSVQAGLAVGPPIGYVLAAINGVLAAANIVKIANTKFDDGGGSSGSAGDVGSLGSTASAPVIPQPNNTTTKISDDGKVENSNIKTGPQEVVIYEGKMSDTQKRSVNIEESAKIG